MKGLLIKFSRNHSKHQFFLLVLFYPLAIFQLAIVRLAIFLTGNSLTGNFPTGNLPTGNFPRKAKYIAKLCDVSSCVDEEIKTICNQE
jgi:hypothetical protein